MPEQIKKTLERTILLNPGPATTSSGVKSSLLAADICPRESEFGEILCQIREKTLQVVHGVRQYESILLGGSGTAAMESVLASAVAQGKKVLILMNGAYGKRMVEICRCYGLSFETLEFNFCVPIEVSQVAEYLQAREGEFAALAFVHHETTSGVLNDLKELHALAQKYGLTSIVDCMSSYAGIPIDLRETDIDYLISSSNKCIQGMAGIGIVLAKRERLSQISTYPKRALYLDLYSNFLAQKEHKQFLFTPPVQILYALNTALDEFLEEGAQGRHQRYCELYQCMYQGMIELGFKSPVAPHHHSKILTTFDGPSTPSFQFEEMHDFLYARGVTIYPGKLQERNTFRIANIGDLEKRDIEKFLGLVRDYLKDKKIFSS